VLPVQLFLLRAQRVALIVQLLRVARRKHTPCMVMGTWCTRTMCCRP
jgi:hypothetical protein